MTEREFKLLLDRQRTQAYQVHYAVWHMAT